jgi:hypothetical protein
MNVSMMGCVACLVLISCCRVCVERLPCSGTCKPTHPEAYTLRVHILLLASMCVLVAAAAAFAQSSLLKASLVTWPWPPVTSTAE